MSISKKLRKSINRTTIIMMAAYLFCGLSYSGAAVEYNSSVSILSNNGDEDDSKKFLTPAIEDIVFLGDSTTNSLRFWEALPGGKDTCSVWSGIDGTLSMWDIARKEIFVSPAMYKSYHDYNNWHDFKEQFRKLDKRNGYAIKISKLTSLVRPKYLVITLGVNGCSSMNCADFSAEYNDLISTIESSSPITTIILNSIFPVGSNFNKFDKKKIDTANRWIADIAASRSLRYINTNLTLSYEGYAPSGLIDSRDGLHWNRNGCARIVESVLACLGKPPQKT